MEMEQQSKQPILYLFVALTASICLAVTIAYLEIRRDAEVEQLRNEVAILMKYVDMLQSKINRTESFSKKFDEAMKSLKATPTAAGGNVYEDDDEYYDDNYDYDYDDTGKVPQNNNNNNSSREKRSIDDNGGRVHNILHMRTYPMFQHAQENPPVMAKILISGEEQTSRPNYVYHRTKEEEVRHGNNRHHKNKMREDAENINGCNNTPVLAHFGGDTSAVTQARHYEGNHRMYHPDGLFKEWSPATWVADLEMDTQVEIDKGIVTITDSPGIYFFYAQIFYADVHDSSGFRVFVNNSPVLQCTTTALSSHNGAHHIKRNSCFTGGLIKLQSGDRISLRELEGRRYTVFEQTKSFFGLFRVAVTQ